MIIKSGGVLYLWDFDGTLFGTDTFKSLRQFNSAAIKSGPYLNPDMYDTRWSILTARPKMDWLFIKGLCCLHGLYPSQIITKKTWRYPKKNTKEDDYIQKEQTIKRILNGSFQIKFTPITIDRVYYIDNDVSCVKYLNSRKGGFDYLAMSVADFSQGTLMQSL